MAKVLLTGGTGLIGSRLQLLLVKKGHDVSVLTRSPKKNNEYRWNIQQGYVDEKAFNNLDYIIHLAGAGVADKRWTSSRKQEIIDSRVRSAELLLQKVTQLKTELKGFISASGIGYYGALTTEKIFTETDTAHTDFIGTVCRLWEEAALKFDAKNIRTVIFRIGIVLSKQGGALAKMKTPVIAPIGTGKQYIPWIHQDDLCALFIKAIEDTAMAGVFNAVAPDEQTSASFSKALVKSTGRPFLSVKIPVFLLRLIFGELSIILLTGSRISAKKIQEYGFRFQFSTLKAALYDLNQVGIS